MSGPGHPAVLACLRRFFASAGGLGAILLVSLLTAACSRRLNNPDLLARQFLDALSKSSSAALDSIIDWHQLILNDYYVTGDFFQAQPPEKQDEIIAAYKKRFYADYLPAAAKAHYLVKKIYIARDICDTHIQYIPPPQGQNSGRNDQYVEFTVTMNLDYKKNRWYIVNLGDFLNLNFLRGNYNPDTIYLPEPIQP